mmetsp:Transcript_4970/g.12164  ORF Transcript_4970/g.12164 Transcript_4970/m.12164 type:complete len:301 (+) Transcript_4970:34-936(+)
MHCTAQRIPCGPAGMGRRDCGRQGMHPIEPAIHQGLLSPRHGAARVQGLRRRGSHHQTGIGDRCQPRAARQAVEERPVAQKGRRVIGIVVVGRSRGGFFRRRRRRGHPAARHGNDAGIARPAGPIRQHGPRIQHRPGEPDAGRKGRKNVRHYAQRGERDALRVGRVLSQRRKIVPATIPERDSRAPGKKHSEPKETAARAHREIGVFAEAIKIAATEHKRTDPAIIIIWIGLDRIGLDWIWYYAAIILLYSYYFWMICYFCRRGLDRPKQGNQDSPRMRFESVWNQSDLEARRSAKRAFE